MIFDDSYNANPASVRAAIEFLAARDGETWLVLGDMAELGAESSALHRDVGQAARNSGVSRLFCVGEHSIAAVEAFGESAEWFQAIELLADAIKAKLKPGITILVKGSRCMGLEALVQELQDRG